VGRFNLGKWGVKKTTDPWLQLPQFNFFPNAYKEKLTVIFLDF
jgi:hypothetical protein